MHVLLALSFLVQQPDTVRLPEVGVTASRIAAPGAGAFTSHTIITGAALAERGLVQLVDALRDVAGLVVVQAGSRGAQTSIFLRGGESDYVKLLVDGVAVNSPGGWFNVANLGTGNIERIEIVRGPGSVLHGSDAMAGVIQVFTRRGVGAIRPTVQVEVGGEQTRRLAGSVVGGGAAGSVALEAGTFTTDGSYPFNSTYRQEGTSGRVATASGGPWQATGTFRLGNSRAEFPTDGSGVLADSNQYTTERQAITGVEVSRRVGDRLTLQVTGSFSRTVEGFRNTMDHPADTLGYGFVASSDSRVRRTGFDLRLLGIQAGPLDATVGIQYEDERQRRSGDATSNFGFGIGTDREQFQADRNTRAWYGEAAVALTPAVRVAGGGRLDDNSAFGTLGSWRLGATASGPAHVVLHGQVGRAFKAPTFSELFARTPFEVGDPRLRPELATSWEIGVSHRLAGERVRAAATWFSQAFDHLIQYAGADPGEPTYANVGAASSRGLEVEVTATPGPHLSISGHGTRLWTRVTDNGGSTSAALSEGQSLIRRPAFSGGVALRWAMAPGPIVRVDLNRLGAREDIDFREFPAQRVTLGARTLVDLSITTAVPVREGRLGVTLRVENLMAASWEQAVGFPGRGRIVHLGMQVGRGR